MKSKEIADAVYKWATLKKTLFTAPYGILQGEHTSRKGLRFHSVTFGKARTLDATVEVYNRNFILYRSNQVGMVRFKSFDELMEYLNVHFE